MLLMQLTWKQARSVSAALPTRVTTPLLWLNNTCHNLWYFLCYGYTTRATTSDIASVIATQHVPQPLLVLHYTWCNLCYGYTTRDATSVMPIHNTWCNLCYGYTTRATTSAMATKNHAWLHKTYHNQLLLYFHAMCIRMNIISYK